MAYLYLQLFMMCSLSFEILKLVKEVKKDISHEDAE